GRGGGTPGAAPEPSLTPPRPREDWRTPAAPARAAAGTLVVDPLTAKRLRLSAGASVRAVPLSAQKRG
ncbi:arginine N-succinyltransferase, partial [Pseudomonas aeruginosa]|nr:arginine N-succinyltransferase [Pseudomonas aeruginosa]